MAFWIAVPLRVLCNDEAVIVEDTNETWSTHGPVVLMSLVRVSKLSNSMSEPSDMSGGPVAESSLYGVLEKLDKLRWANTHIYILSDVTKRIGRVGTQFGAVNAG